MESPIFTVTQTVVHFLSTVLLIILNCVYNYYRYNGSKLDGENLISVTQRNLNKPDILGHRNVVRCSEE